jgi:site-specific DNA recombinase
VADKGHRSELAKIHRTLKQMLSAIEEGRHTRGRTERMRELEGREDVLKELLAQEPADIPDIHPNVSVIYRKKVERLKNAILELRRAQPAPTDERRPI